MSSKNGCTRQLLLALFLCLTTASLAQAVGGEDLDVYKWRVSGLWWFSKPTGSFTGKANSGTFDLSRDFNFGSYSTFSGLADWRFKRKHHLLLGVSPVTSSRRATLNRTVEFQGVTYDVGTSVAAEIKSLSIAPGYQYDIIRRNRISLSIATQVYLLNTSADLSGTVTVNGNPKSRRHQDQFLPPCQ